jgi:hypothetical protein
MSSVITPKKLLHQDSLLKYTKTFLFGFLNIRHGNKFPCVRSDVAEVAQPPRSAAEACCRGVRLGRAGGVMGQGACGGGD